MNRAIIAAGADRILGFADLGILAGQRELVVTVATPPSDGLLLLAGPDGATPVTAGQTLALDAIAAGRLVYRASPSATPGDAAALTFAIAGLWPGAPADADTATAVDHVLILDVRAIATDTAAHRIAGSTGIAIGAESALVTSTSAVTWSTAMTGAVVDNAGVIRATAADARAINATGALATEHRVTLINHEGALIQSANDAFRVNRDMTAGALTVDNAGAIIATGSGQALDFDAIASAAAGTVVITNHASGVIRALAADAIRPGQNALVDNAGLIWSDGVIGDKNDGVDFQGRSGAVLNRDGALISGQRHGITSDTNVEVVNEAGGVIIGRNGSGIGSDGSGKVVNFGRITGSYVGTGNGDGDGVDIDGYGEVENYGIIEGTGAGGPDNGAEGVLATRGGVITNHVGASITGIVRGVTTGYGTIVNNDGLIEGTGPNDTPEAADGMGGAAGGAVNNSATGIIRGAMRGLFLDGGFAIANAGLIDGTFQGILFLGASTNALDNRGRITSQYTTVQAQGGANTIVNSGVLAADRIGILVEAGVNTIDLSSTSVVSGGFYGIAAVGASQNTIRNAGTVEGSIRLDNGDDIVINSGVVQGAVLLGAGDDTFTQRNGGAVDGVVDGEGGHDVFVIDQDAQTTLSAAGALRFEEIVQHGRGTVFYLGDFDAQTIRIESGRLAVRADTTLSTAGATTITGGDAGVTIANKGLIAGAVLLGAGDDAFTSSGTTGRIDMGAGDDILRLTSDARFLGTAAGGAGDDSLAFLLDHSDIRLELGMFVGFEHLSTLGGGGLVLAGDAFAFADVTVSGSLEVAADARLTATRIAGGAGDDRFVVAGDVDAPIDGGAGHDTLDLSGGAHGVRVVDWSGPTDPSAIRVSNVEQVVGSDHDDSIVMPDAVVGLAIAGGAGDDMLIGGGGADLIDGGSGMDRTVYRSFFRDASVTIEHEDVDVATVAAGADRLRSIEYIQFNDGYFTTDPNGNAARAIRAYLAVAGRMPDDGELDAATGALDGGGALATLVMKLAGHDDALGVHAGTSSADFVQGLYASLFARAADPAGLEHWIGVLESGEPRDLVATTFIDSGEFRALTGDRIGGVFIVDESAEQVMSLYHVLGRMPDQEGFEYWLGQLGGGAMTIGQISDAFGRSDEWTAQTVGLSDPQLIDHVFQTTFGRRADGVERDHWTSALDQGLTRAALLGSFAWSDEHQRAMLDYLHANTTMWSDM